MKEVLFFEYPRCPYCSLAKRLLKKIQDEQPKYAEVTFKVIDEVKHSEIAEQYNYYYTPCFFYEEQKLFECDPKWDAEEMEQRLRAMLDTIIQ